MSAVDIGRLLVLLELANAEGEDPRYSDSFSQIRAEVEKLSGNDFERIAELGHQILEQQGLDLRALAYLSLSYTFLAGASGLTAALAGWNWVLKERWESSFPLREAGRQGAVEWLTNNRFAVYLQRHESSDDSVTQLRQELDQFHQQLVALLGEDRAPRLREVDKWLKDKEKQRQSVAVPVASDAAGLEVETQQGVEEAPAPAPAADNRAAISRPATPATASSHGDGAIDSDKAEQKMLRELLAWYRQEKRFLPLVSVARVMRWGEMRLPPAEKGKTRLPPPRPASLNAVTAALDRKQWEEALLAAERAFLEPGGQFCLQIQQQSHQAASALGLNDVSACIERELQALLERHRELIKLSFSNGEPFMAGSAANWVESLLQPASQAATDQDDKWAQLAINAAAINNEQGLVAALTHLDQVPTRGRRQRCEQELLKAELCLLNQRQDLALPLLEAISERAEDHGIANWDPQFALRVWRLLQQALRAQENNDNVQQRLEQISHCISRTDVTAAAAML